MGKSPMVANLPLVGYYVKCNVPKALAVLRDFKGLQGLQTQRVRFQIFRRVRPFSAIFPPPPRRIPRRPPRGFERWFSVAEGIAHV
jgi:hypothetical protein